MTKKRVSGVSKVSKISKVQKVQKVSRWGDCFICHQHRELVQDHRHLAYEGDDVLNACKQRERLCSYCNGRYRLAPTEAFIRSLAKDRNITLRAAGELIVDYITADYSMRAFHPTQYTEHRKAFMKLSATEQKKLSPGSNAKFRCDAYIKELKKQHKDKGNG